MEKKTKDLLDDLKANLEKETEMLKHIKDLLINRNAKMSKFALDIKDAMNTQPQANPLLKCIKGGRYEPPAPSSPLISKEFRQWRKSQRPEVIQ